MLRAWPSSCFPLDGMGEAGSMPRSDLLSSVLSRVIVDNEKLGRNPLTRPRRLTG